MIKNAENVLGVKKGLIKWYHIENHN
jgi:hypothetical protein